MVLTGRNNNNKSYSGRAREFFGQEKVKYFIGGMVAAYAIKKIAETDTAHDLAVSATAGFLNFKDSVEETVENIKEDAEDIHTEAQQKQQIEVFGPEDFDDEDEEEDEE
ncbi:MAG: hypothetical protein E7Z86_00285 [Methanosphaera stadtmanae]|jgi:hypothetical protein|nr:hypothetical protein [Methanosphaera stadtmanae]